VPQVYIFDFIGPFLFINMPYKQIKKVTNPILLTYYGCEYLQFFNRIGYLTDIVAMAYEIDAAITGSTHDGILFTTELFRLL